MSFSGWRDARGLAMLLSVLVLVGCDSEPSSASAAAETPTVAVFEVEAVNIETRRNWLGTLMPLQVLAVTAPESGRISDLLVSDGERVERGQELAFIDGPEFGARRDVLRARRAALAEDLQRWQRLAEADAAGPGEVEAARLRLLEIEEALAELEQRDEAARLTAPVSGRVIELAVREGSRTERGELLMRVEADDSLGLRLILPAAEIDYLAEPEKLSFGPHDLEAATVVTYQRDGLPRGFLAADIRLRGELAQWPRELTVGYAAEEAALIVPWTAVARDGDRHWVARVSGEPPQIERVDVVTGRGRADGIEIIEGLERNDRIVRHEPRAFADGQSVQIAESGRD